MLARLRLILLFSRSFCVASTLEELDAKIALQQLKNQNILATNLLEKTLHAEIITLQKVNLQLESSLAQAQQQLATEEQRLAELSNQIKAFDPSMQESKTYKYLHAALDSVTAVLEMFLKLFRNEKT